MLGTSSLDNYKKRSEYMEEPREAKNSSLHGLQGMQEVGRKQPMKIVDPSSQRKGELENPLVTVDVLMMSLRQKDLQMLLIKRRFWPFEDMWAIPGGFVNTDESLEEAAKRELQEKTGVQDVYLEQLYTFGNPGRDPRARVITVVYFALLDAERLQVRVATDTDDLNWFSVYDLPPLAFDHKEIVEYALNRLRNKLDYTTIAFNLLPEQFTLRELQSVYETILHKRLDKRNFRKKILSTGILEDTGAKKMEGTHRPARLYCFNPHATHEL